MYASLVLMQIGVLLKSPDVLNGILFGVGFLAALGTAMGEEREMIQRFGDDNREYMKGTWRFIPFLI